MKTLLPLLSLCLSCFTSLGAGFKISDLTQTNTVAGTEWLELDQGGVKSWKISTADLFKALGTNSTVTIINVTTNVNNYSYTTNSYVQLSLIYTNYTTNLYVVQYEYVNNSYITNLYVNWNYTTNLFVNNEYTDISITTNLTVVNQITAKTIIVTNLYVENPIFGLQQLTNVAVSNVLNGEVLTWNSAMKKWSNSPPTVGIITNVGFLVTNIAYNTNLQMDFSFVYNDYYMTNQMGNHVFIIPTNMVDGQVFCLSIQGASSYTNLQVFFGWPPTINVTWLSITNGSPTTLISSNKTQFYSFKTRMSSTKTNVIAAFKEEP